MTTPPVVHPHHLCRQAVLSLRQSTGHPVLTNRERQQLQHAMREQAHHLGWPEERIEVVETALGRTAQRTDRRDGSKSLRAAAALGQVGSVRSDERPRLSRHCTDWYPWLARCAYNQGLIADRHGGYEAATPHGRLLLGMKGIVREVALHPWRGRRIAGGQQQAQRGDLALALPAGWLRQDDGVVVQEPARAVQQALPLVVQPFLERNSARPGVRLFRDHGLRWPRRHRNRETVWRPPTVAAVMAIVRNPAYAGAFASGKRQTQGPPAGGGPRQRRVPRAEWKVLVHDRYPAYVTWEPLERIAAILADHDGA
jgi:DNA invertase Pin-like site-specific DNA recombinase